MSAKKEKRINNKSRIIDRTVKIYFLGFRIQNLPRYLIDPGGLQMFQLLGNIQYYHTTKSLYPRSTHEQFDQKLAVIELTYLAFMALNKCQINITIRIL